MDFGMFFEIFLKCCLMVLCSGITISAFGFFVGIPIYCLYQLKHNDGDNND